MPDQLHIIRWTRRSILHVMRNRPHFWSFFVYLTQNCSERLDADWSTEGCANRLPSNRRPLHLPPGDSQIEPFRNDASSEMHSTRSWSHWPVTPIDGLKCYSLTTRFHVLPSLLTPFLSFLCALGSDRPVLVSSFDCYRRHKKKFHCTALHEENKTYVKKKKKK